MESVRVQSIRREGVEGVRGANPSYQAGQGELCSVRNRHGKTQGFSGLLERHITKDTTRNENLTMSVLLCLSRNEVVQSLKDLSTKYRSLAADLAALYHGRHTRYIHVLVEYDIPRSKKGTTIRSTS